MKEQEEFVLGEGRETVRQLEYGLSLKGNYSAGIVRGFEVNAYRTNASSHTDSVETGDMTGLQIVTQLKPIQGADIRLGAGYEHVAWSSGAKDDGFTFQASGTQRLSDRLSLNFEEKSAETENVFGIGLTQDISTPEMQNSTFSLDLVRIEGKHGISDDTRIALNWTFGLGAGGSGVSDAPASSIGAIARSDLLADVMSRPAFLPERVLAHAARPKTCEDFGIYAEYDGASRKYLAQHRGYADVFLISTNPDLTIDESIGVMVGGVPFHFSGAPSPYLQFYTEPGAPFDDNASRLMQITIGDFVCTEQISGAT